MRIECPLCGSRDRREFYYRGEAVGLHRPAPDAGAEAWQDFVHLRENTAGWREELWLHAAGCSSWLIVERHTTTHEIRAVRLASEEAR